MTGFFLNLIFSSFMLLASIISYFTLPKKFDSIYGYRTPLSLRNEANWIAANNYSTQLQMKLSFIWLIISVISGGILIRVDLETINTISVFMFMGFGLFAGLGIRYFTERHLKKINGIN